MNNQSPKTLSYLLIFFAGFGLFWLSQKNIAMMPRPISPLVKSFPVKLSGITKEDDWILNFNVNAVSLSDVMSYRRYLLLVLEKKIDCASKIANRAYHKKSAFYLKGFSGSDVALGVTIDASTLKEIENGTYSLLVDLPGPFFSSRKLEPSSLIEMSSISD
jgi:hypothetical protein